MTYSRLHRASCWAGAWKQIFSQILVNLQLCQNICSNLNHSIFSPFGEWVPALQASMWNLHSWDNWLFFMPVCHLFALAPLPGYRVVLIRTWNICTMQDRKFYLCSWRFFRVLWGKVCVFVFKRHRYQCDLELDVL